MKNIKTAVAAACLAVMALAGCSEMDRETAPVELIATSQQEVFTIDLLNPPDTLGTVTLRALVKRSDPTDTRFLDVRLTRYRVSWRRVDGGTLVPEPLVRPISGLVTVGGAPTPLNDFLVIEERQVRQAPFVALLPQNGGRDPETGQNIVRMDMVLDVFGETLSGEAVSARVTERYTFCAGCS
jgi:hypothetical protein